MYPSDPTPGILPENILTFLRSVLVASFMCFSSSLVFHFAVVLMTLCFNYVFKFLLPLVNCVYRAEILFC